MIAYLKTLIFVSIPETRRQLGADGHVPIVGGRSCDIQTWLRKQLADRSSATTKATGVKQSIASSLE